MHKKILLLKIITVQTHAILSHINIQQLVYYNLLQTLHSLIIQRVETCFLQAEDYLNFKFTRPNINFNQRGRIAGSAYLIKNELRFNSSLLQDNYALFIQEVVPHEVSHIICFQLYGKVKPHGKEWKSIMQNVFGLLANIYHSMDTSKVTGYTFSYQCACDTVQLSIRRHNKVVRGKQQYQCKKCQQILKPITD